MTHKCRICGWTGETEELFVREMLYDTRDEFAYFECEQCHCLQIAKVPENLGNYYMGGYYSYRMPKGHDTKVNGPREMLRVLDVGCGAGEFLCKLAMQGYIGLVGCDPFIRNDIVYDNGVHIYKCEIHNMTGQFDFIYLNDSFEHVTDPHEVMESIKRLLSPKGIVRIKIPVYPNVAFDMFREHWFQIDAPRHIFLHSKYSMEYLAEKHGLQIIKREFDSCGEQIFRSYLYSIDISFGKQTREVVYQHFTEDDLRDLRESSEIANKNEYGDHAMFYLTHL